MKIILGKKEQANMEVRMREEKGKREKRKKKKKEKKGGLAEGPGARVYHMGRTNEGKTKWLR